MKKLLNNPLFYLVIAIVLSALIYFSELDKRWIIAVSFIYFIPSQILYRKRWREKMSQDD